LEDQRNIVSLLLIEFFDLEELWRAILVDFIEEIHPHFLDQLLNMVEDAVLVFDETADKLLSHFDMLFDC
jgi:hypothetical protein